MSTELVLRVLRAGFLIVILVLTPSLSRAQWQSDGIPLTGAGDDQVNPVVVSDGAGGAIVAWEDSRNGNTDIYAQRVDAAGVRQWRADGVALCIATGDQTGPMIVSDGAGGAIVTWQDARNGDKDVYAQRVDASGTVMWTADGVALGAATGDQTDPVLATDGAGGAIVTWTDARNILKNIYAQRVDATGTVLWTVDGAPICTAANDGARLPAIVSDDAGGAVVVWIDSRNADADIYAQRVDGSGAVQWTVDGVPLCTAVGEQSSPRVATDGAGGAIATWDDHRVAPPSEDIYAQRIDMSGTVQWTPDGVPICNEINIQDYPEIVSDDAGGAIITWVDLRADEGDVYAQRVNSVGIPQWTPNGVGVSTAQFGQGFPQIIPDGAGGAIVTWGDARNSASDIYAQRLNAFGVAQWTLNGVGVCTAPGYQTLPMIAADGAGGAILAWQDPRSGTEFAYAQRVDGRYGEWGHPEPILYAVKDVPADNGGKVNVEWYASGREVTNSQFISHYSIWRALDAAAARASMQAGVPEVGLAQVGSTFTGPAIREEKTATGDYFWELVGTQNAAARTAYSFAAPTGFDSTRTGPADHQFQVAAHALSDDYINWPSNVMSGHSVDNMPPGPPRYLTAERAGNGVLLTWDGVHVSDFKEYAVYRASASGVTPVAANFLTDATDTVVTDSHVPSGPLYYIVTAYDIHDNQSVASNEVGVKVGKKSGQTPAITQLMVLQNAPNPFTTETEFQVGLPAPSDVSVEIYDVAGRRVGQIEVKGAGAGWQQIPFAGRDAQGRALASGVYFYRVTANGTTVTRKMVITR